MYESTVSYSLSRPYPYRWITWVAVIGGIVAAVLFSVINLAANGYDPFFHYAADPNETEHPKAPAWYQTKPWSLASKVSSTCQDRTLDIGSEFYTNNSGLFFKVVGIIKEVEGQFQPRVSFIYHNDPFHDCWITDLNVNTTVDDKETMAASAYVNCTLYEAGSPMTVKLEVSAALSDGFYHDYKYAGYQSFGRSAFQYPDNRTQAGLFWGQEFISWYVYMGMKMNTSSLKCNADETGVYCSIALRDEYFLFQETDIEFTHIPLDRWTSTFGLDMLTQNLTWDESTSDRLNVSSPTANVSVYVDGLGKSFYSLILSDLGQATEWNIFANPQRVMDFMKSADRSNQVFGWDWTPWEWPEDMYFANATPDETTAFFNYLNTSVPHVNPAVIATQYLCQVPKRKAIGSVIVTVVVADLVFLQTLWTVFNWIVQRILERHDPEANYCAGCAKARTKDELLSETSATASSYSLGRYGSAPDPVQPNPFLQSAAPVIRRRPASGAASSEPQEQNETTVRLLPES